MIRMTAILLASLGAALTPAAAHDRVHDNGVFRTGAELHALCTATQPDALARCDAYLMAAHDMTAYMQQVRDLDRDICPPADITAEALRAAALTYWQEHPGELALSAIGNLDNAFLAAFPCR